MRRPALPSIRRRLMALAAAISVLTLGIGGSLLAVNSVHMLRGEMLRDLEVLSVVVGDNCLSALVFDAPETAEKILGSLRREPQIRHAVLYDPQGRLFAQYRRDDTEPVGAPLRDEEGAHLDVSLLGLGSVEVLRELKLDGRTVGKIFIHARTDRLATQLKHYLAVAGVLLLVTLAASMLVALRLQRRVSQPILRLAARTQEISERGDYRERVSQPPSVSEIDILVKGLNELLTAIQEREHALKTHADALDTANTRLRALATEISLVEERERKRLAAQLHDSAMQKLAIAQLQIGAAVEDPERADVTGGEERLDVGLVLIREALSELRNLQFELSPPALYLDGLAPALESLAAHIKARCGIEIAYVQAGELPEPSVELAVVLYQCARELVYNIVKHSAASKGAIVLRPGPGTLEIEVQDDGQGFERDFAKPPTGASGGYGLYSVRERIVSLGGSLQVESGTHGSRVTIQVPTDAAVSVPSPVDPRANADSEFRQAHP